MTGGVSPETVCQGCSQGVSALGRCWCCGDASGDARAATGCASRAAVSRGCSRAPRALPVLLPAAGAH
jgi:hypothetical protein